MSQAEQTVYSVSFLLGEGAGGKVWGDTVEVTERSEALQVVKEFEALGEEVHVDPPLDHST